MVARSQSFRIVLYGRAVPFSPFFPSHYDSPLITLTELLVVMLVVLVLLLLVVVLVIGAIPMIGGHQVGVVTQLIVDTAFTQ